LPRPLVHRARTTMESNKGTERKYLARGWELRGLVRCSCGSPMGTHTTKPSGGRVYHYYKCKRRSEAGRLGSCRQKALRAEQVEPAIWRFLSSLLKDPDRIGAGMEKLIEHEKAIGRGDPGQESRAWAEKLEECARLRKAYQQQQAAGLMTLDELGRMLEEVEDIRRLAETELKTAAARLSRVEGLEEDRDGLLEYMPSTVPEALDDLTGEERNRVYRMLRLEVSPTPEGYEVRGAFCATGLPRGWRPCPSRARRSRRESPPLCP
jgi:Recombinase zinc beta ribbon domain